MWQKAREYLLDRDNYFRERNTLRRAYYQEALTHLTNQEFEESIILYKKSITRLNNIKKYNLAGVSLAFVSLLLIKEKRFNEIEILLEEIKEKLSGLWELFSKMFSVELTEYLIKAGNSNLLFLEEVIPRIKRIFKVLASRRSYYEYSDYPFTSRDFDFIIKYSYYLCD